MAEKAFLLGVNTKGLKYAVTDVSLMQACLKQHGYEIVIPQFNKTSINKTSIIEQFDEFIDGLNKSDTVIFYYSGHGYLLKTKLQLVLDDNYVQSRQGYIEIDWFTNAFRNCEAKDKLIILDCCNAGAVAQDWQLGQSEYYRILTASERLETTKELLELKAGFLTFYIHKGLTEYAREIVNQDGEIRLNRFYEWLKLKAHYHISHEALRLPIPNLLGNQKADFLVAKIPDSLPVLLSNSSRTSIELSSYINLPHRDYQKLIGREDELKKLLQYIHPSYRQHITIVEGIGGVGKTALVLEAAYRCWEIKGTVSQVNIPEFDAIIFTSAKQTYLTPNGVSNRLQVEATLQDIFRVIALTLDDPTITRAAVGEQLGLVKQRLSKQRTLLIIDNFETLEDKERQEVISFLDDLPSSTQAIITTRERVVFHRSIQLGSLSEDNSLRLIQQQAQDKDGLELTRQQAKRLYHRFGGIPAALIYTVGQKAMGYSPKRILKPSVPLPKDIARFCFEGSVNPLRKQAAHKLLMSLAIFQIAPTWNALARVAGLTKNPLGMEEGLAKLQQLSLVREQDGLYSILPITREYALVELASNRSFEEEARERWVSWYQEFTQKYGGQDWKEWWIKYDYLAKEWENIAAVLFWCAAHDDRYEDIKGLWQNIDNYVDLSGDWLTRRHWWRWLARESNRRADLSTHVTALVERGWTLTLMGGNYRNEAAQELKKAWRMREHADSAIRVRLAIYIAVHRMTRKQYAQALKWLVQSEELLQQELLDQRERIRYQTCIFYYRAEISYQRGEHSSAKEYFQQVIEYGKDIGWQRFVIYAQNWLADIAIKQGELQKAESLLQTGLFVAEQSRERRRVALYQAVYARLEAARGNQDQARKWAKEALEVFNDKIMADEEQEMQILLDSLK